MEVEKKGKKRRNLRSSEENQGSSRGRARGERFDSKASDAKAKIAFRSL